MQISLYEKLSVLRGILSDRLFSAFLSGAAGRADFNIFLNELYSRRCESDFFGYVGELILTDDNAFSRCCAEGREPSPYLKKAFICDLNSIYEYLLEADTGDKFCKGSLPSSFEIDSAEKSCEALALIYKKHGFGTFIRHRAFYFDGGLKPVEKPSDIRLFDLKKYQSEKRAIDNNVSAFLAGLPFSDMLLYGDKGTGKSSTVHAMLNEYADSGLKLIEITAGQLGVLPDITREAESLPFKFLVFADDLSAGDEATVSALKSGLQGSVSGRHGNVMFVATSNRRNIVSESFSDRQNAVHPSDCIESALSLSDRFGLTVMFSQTDRAQYLSITEQLAADAGLKMRRDELFALAERWALLKGGRSPRRAKQIVDMVYSCSLLNRSIEL